MSVIAWDGRTLATDKMAVCGDTPRATIKSEIIGNDLVAWAGGLGEGIALCDWYKTRDVTKWPEFQHDNERWTVLVAVNKQGIWFYEMEPYPVPVLDKFVAFGCGRDVAIGAMHMGANAVEAVEAACAYDINCGCGIDAYRIDGGVWNKIL